MDARHRRQRVGAMGRLSGADGGRRRALVEQLRDPEDPQARQELYRLLFLSLGTGFTTTFADAEAPGLRVAGEHAYSMRARRIRIFSTCRPPSTAPACYRISGFRGTALFVHGDIVAGGLGVMR